MNIKHITENLQSIVAGAREIESELDSGSGSIGEALELYEALDSNGTTTDSDEIIQAVEFYAELEGDSTVDLAKISEALGLLSRIEHGGHDPNDVLTALDVYATVANGPIHLSDLEGALETADEWSQECGHTWESPGSMAQGLSDQHDIVSVFERVTALNILSVEDAELAASLLVKLPAKERALLDAIKAFLSAVGQQ